MLLALSLLFAAGFLLAPVAVGSWASRLHDRSFPAGFDRTGWEPGRGRPPRRRGPVGRRQRR